MRPRDWKREVFFVRKAFFEYRQGWAYLRSRFRARKILKETGPLDRPADIADFSMHLLTGRRDFVIAMWSLRSFYRKSFRVGKLYLHDDGTLGPREKTVFARLFPEADIVRDVSISDPILRGFRERYPDYFSFKKIVDPYFVSDKPWRLILDSDVLWFKNPDELISVLESNSPVSYMQFNNGVIFGTQANAGIVLYRKDHMDLGKLVEVFNGLGNDPRRLHFADQLGYAKALEHLELLPRDRYTIKNPVDSTTVAKHFTSPRRPLYYLEGLK